MIPNRGWRVVVTFLLAAGCKDADESPPTPASDSTTAVARSPSPARPGDFELGVEAYEKKDYDLAVAYFTKAVAAAPNAPAAYFYRGLTYRDKKEYDKSVADFTDAIRLEPAPAACYYNRGVVRVMAKDFGKALKDFDESARLEPKNPTPFTGRGWAYEEAKEYEKAVADYETAIRLDPKMSVGHNNLAWVRATCPDAKFRDGKTAVELARKACELSGWKSWHELNTLAAAYAESGDFREAVRWQKKAFDVGTDDEDFLGKARRRMKLYEKGQPYRRE